MDGPEIRGALNNVAMAAERLAQAAALWHLRESIPLAQVIERLNREVVKALKMPDVIDRLATQGGNDLVGNTPEEFAQVIKSDLALYAKIIKAAGIRSDKKRNMRKVLLE